MLTIAPSIPLWINGPSKLDVIVFIISNRISTKEYMVWFPLFLASFSRNRGEYWDCRYHHLKR